LFVVVKQFCKVKGKAVVFYLWWIARFSPLKWFVEGIIRVLYRSSDCTSWQTAECSFLKQVNGKKIEILFANCKPKFYPIIYITYIITTLDVRERSGLLAFESNTNVPFWENSSFVSHIVVTVQLHTLLTFQSLPPRQSNSFHLFTHLSLMTNQVPIESPSFQTHLARLFFGFFMPDSPAPVLRTISHCRPCLLLFNPLARLPVNQPAFCLIVNLSAVSRYLNKWSKIPGIVCLHLGPDTNRYNRDIDICRGPSLRR